MIIKYIIERKIELLFMLLLCLLITTNIMIIAEIHTLKNELHDLDVKLKAIERFTSTQRTTLGELTDSTTSHSKVIIGIVSLTLLTGLALYLFGFDPKCLGDSFTLLQKTNTEGFNDILKVNHSNFAKIYDCFGKNQNHINDLKQLLSSQLKNISNTVLQLQSDTGLGDKGVTGLQNASNSDI